MKKEDWLEEDAGLVLKILCRKGVLVLSREVLSFLERPQISLARLEWGGLRLSPAPSFSKDNFVPTKELCSLTIEKSNGLWLACSSISKGEVSIYFWPFCRAKEFDCGSSGPVHCHAFGSSLLATASRHDFKVWRITKESILLLYSQSIENIQCLASQDKAVFAGMKNGFVFQVYPKVKELITVQEHGSYTMALSPERKWILVRDIPYLFIAEDRVKPKRRLGLQASTASFIDDDRVAIASQREGVLVLLLFASEGCRLIAKLYSGESPSTAVALLATGPGYVALTHLLNARNKLLLVWSYSTSEHSKTTTRRKKLDSDSLSGENLKEEASSSRILMTFYLRYRTLLQPPPAEDHHQTTLHDIAFIQNARTRNPLQREVNEIYPEQQSFSEKARPGPSSGASSSSGGLALPSPASSFLLSSLPSAATSNTAEDEATVVLRR